MAAKKKLRVGIIGTGGIAHAQVVVELVGGLLREAFDVHRVA